jgi:hypothetical protein
MLFAINTAVVLITTGLCEVFIEVDGVQQRRLAFDVLAPKQP